MSKRKIPSKQDIESFLHSLPGKRDIDIPAQIFDRIQPVAHGMAMQVWGRPIEPQQLQDLYDQGHHQPEQVKQALGMLPHPHSPSITVSEYAKYSAAKQMFDQSQGDTRARR